MKNQIKRAEPSRGASEAASPGALRAARTIFRHMPPDDPKVIATAEEIDRESGHVVLLEALREMVGYMRSCELDGDTPVALRIVERAEAAIKQAERT